MKNQNLAEWTVNEVAANIPGAADVLHARGISGNNRMNLANAAAAATTTTDELLAVMNYRMRRAARQPQAEEARTAEVEAGELVA